MKLLVLSDEASLNELKAFPFDQGIELSWLRENPDEESGARYDAVIDLLNDGNEGWISRLHASSELVIVSDVYGPVNEGFVRINGWKTFLQRPVIEAVSTAEEWRAPTEELFGKLGRRVEWVPDISGMISARVVCAIINEAFYALEQGISTKKEIDTAMKMGTNYPFGPFEWGEKIGWKRIYSLMEQLGNEEERYKPSSLLKQAALA